MRAAPPTPTTTPIIVRFDPELRPELPEPPSLELRLGVVVLSVTAVVTATRALVVSTWEKVLLPLTVRTVVTTSLVALDTLVVVIVVGVAELVCVEPAVVGSLDEAESEAELST